MTAKAVLLAHYPRRARYLALAVAGLLAALPGHARATLFDPILEATTGNPSSPSTTSATSGPVSSTHSNSVNSSAAWTDYGINRASSHVAASTSDTITPSTFAISKWTDRLIIDVPGLASDTPINFFYSFRLDGSLAAHEDDFTTATASVIFQTFSGDNTASGRTYEVNTGLISVTPTPSSTAGGDASATIHETLFGSYGVYDSLPFNVIARLETRAGGGFVGPTASLSADSLFGSSAEWLGGSVTQTDGSPVSSFTITSGSGHNYNSPAPVPEPGTLLLLGSGLVGLGGAAWRRKRGSAPSSDSKRG